MRLGILFFVLSAALQGSGAASVHAATGARPPADSASWLRGLYGRPTVSRADALRAALLCLDDAHWKPDEDWAAREGRGRGLVDQDDARDLGARATRGFGCSVFARALKIRGGLMMRLTGSAGRYAFRELVALGMIPDGPSHVSLTGDELAGLLLAASRYQDRGPERPPGR